MSLENPTAGSPALPEGVSSLLDTDLYKLTMQCAVLKYFPETEVTYAFTNRTADMRLTRGAYHWLQKQVDKLENIALSDEELGFLRTHCSYLNEAYLSFLKDFRLRPTEQLKLAFRPFKDTGSDQDRGNVEIDIRGRWVDTILYEIPLLALVSEAYFKFCDTDWNHEGQEDKAYHKGLTLLEYGCVLSEFGSRRRRDYYTQELVLRGLCRAAAVGAQKGWKGKLSGTSNVHFAMKHGLTPVGTVAHEWFMGVAAITNNYEQANEISLRYWVGTFGEGVLGIALTDTFGTPTFLKAFKQPIPSFSSAGIGGAPTLASTGDSTTLDTLTSLGETNPPPIHAPVVGGETEAQAKRTFAQVFTGVRQDSGDPAGFIKLMREFYDEQGIKDKKIIVFSDSLNVERCLEYMQEAQDAGFQPTFGVGTFLTNDFTNTSNGLKSVPLNIVIKLASAGGRPAVKISDNIGKNTGDKSTVERVKRQLGYVERDWEGGDETSRWGTPESGVERPTSVTN
ncbi:nicotinate phosphoribosyltransferas-like protein [Xylona heveae TC161]|uniref:nicotinate phosphoribosyltransferase n=1 Tax=Xylona heveae (strain CBS 132557 / TC161) TaxID=1328760 RepID=A0A165I1M3_XYLHT|nr:nicotinate phosphoribosyltransferas-like protein [Xylona heveae TC161]KZF24230.1 nicotinate phosphoribosyltransferas-like protein [Xylona heveae TC161]